MEEGGERREEEGGGGVGIITRTPLRMWGNNKKKSNEKCILALTRRILDESPPYFACGDFLHSEAIRNGPRTWGALK